MNQPSATFLPLALRALFPEARFLGCGDVNVRSVSVDERACRNGDLFVCLETRQSDQQAAIRAAISRGATAILTDRECDIAGRGITGTPLCVVDDVAEAYAVLCQHLLGNPSSRLKLIGIMGSLGKTNTAMLTTAALDAHGHNVAVASSLGVFDGFVRRDIDIRLLGPSGLARWLAESVAVGCTHAVLEIPADPRWSDRLAGLTFETLCLTNIIDDERSDPWGGSVPSDDRSDTSWLPQLVDSLTPEAALVFNADDAPARRVAEGSDRPALAVGSDDTSQLAGSILETHIGEQTLLLSAGNTTVPLRTPLAGEFQLGNSLLATGVALIEGGDITTAVRGLETVRIVPGRLEPVSCGQAFSVFVDAAPTLDALGHALASVRPAAGGRIICGLIPQSGAAAQLDSANQTMRRFVALAESECETVIAGEPEEVAERALSAAQPGDCVLITRCGRADLTSRVAMGEDSQRVRDWLYANLPNAQPAVSWS